MVTKKEISKVMKELGKRGGKVKSEAKTAAVKKNAALGGIARANKYKQKRISEGATKPAE